MKMKLKLFNREKARRERVLAAFDKMVADKRAIQECIWQGKSLTTLKDKGVVLVKFRTVP
jgi:hypothetical protein